MYLIISAWQAADTPIQLPTIVSVSVSVPVSVSVSVSVPVSVPVFIIFPPPLSSIIGIAVGVTSTVTLQTRSRFSTHIVVVCI